MKVSIFTGAWKWKYTKERYLKLGKNARWLRILFEIWENCLELNSIHFLDVTVFLSNHERFFIDRRVKGHIATVLVFSRVRFFFITFNFQLAS